MIYTATISSTPLRLRETRIVADLLLQGASDTDWNEAVTDRNVLQIASPIAAWRSARILRARLEPLGAGLWTMVRDGPRDQATQAALAGAVKQSRLLGDFMDLALREQRKLFAKALEPRMWTDYMEGCWSRDPELKPWSESTVNKLRSVVFSMLAEAGYLSDTRTLLLQTVFVDRELADYLRERDERYVLRCLEVAE